MLVSGSVVKESFLFSPKGSPEVVGPNDVLKWVAFGLCDTQNDINALYF